jgi:phosphoribosylformimino-5-aminoimidazole carboxamide ribotide isomerase
MEVIPVLDLKGGLVVRARMGERHRYRPIVTPLSPSSDPIAVAKGLLTLYPFRTLYIADLDAIEGRVHHRRTLAELKRRHPHVALWVDNGIADPAAAVAWLDQDLGHLVLGSETQRSVALVRDLAPHERVVLSLDFRAAAFQGPPQLLADPAIWPRRIVAMTLARVGSSAGPDLERLSAIRQAAPDRRVYAAGGVRGRADLMTLARVGIAGALVASSLHDATLHAEEIAAVEHCAANA